MPLWGDCGLTRGKTLQRTGAPPRFFDFFSNKMEKHLHICFIMSTFASNYQNDDKYANKRYKERLAKGLDTGFATENSQRCRRARNDRAVTRLQGLRRI